MNIEFCRNFIARLSMYMPTSPGVDRAL